MVVECVLGQAALHGGGRKQEGVSLLLDKVLKTLKA